MLLITCEHGGRRVPREYCALFRGAGDVLRSHRGWDPGALSVALRLAELLAAPVVYATTTRLLVELNRSLGHPRLFSVYTKGLPAAARERLLAEHYRPHRGAVEAVVAGGAARGVTVVHLAVHSFTPVLEGRRRPMHAGLLYDPRRVPERALCHGWAEALRGVYGDGPVALNRPYTGVSDGLSAYLRKRYGPSHYVGVEVELRQDLLVRRADQAAWAARLSGTLRPFLTMLT